MNQTDPVPKRVPLLHVEDSPHWLGLVELLVQSWEEVRYIGSAQTIADGQILCERHPCALLILDLWLPDGDGLVLAERMRSQLERTKIIVCSARTDAVALYHYDRLLLDGFLCKENFHASTLRNAISAVLAGNRYFSPELYPVRNALRADPQAYFKLLSSWQQQLMPLFGRGFSDEDIACQVESSVPAIRSQRKRIMGKLGIHRTIDLMHWASRNGFVPPVTHMSNSRLLIQ